MLSTLHWRATSVGIGAVLPYAFVGAHEVALSLFLSRNYSFQSGAKRKTKSIQNMFNQFSDGRNRTLLDEASREL